MLILDHLGIELLDGCDLRLLSLSDLNEHHREGDKGTLSDEVYLVVCQRCEELQCVDQTTTCTANADCEGSSIPDVRIVRLSQLLDEIRQFFRLPEEQKAKVH